LIPTSDKHGQSLKSFVPEW